MDCGDFGALPNLSLMFFKRAERHDSRPFLWAKQGSDWQPLSWRDAAEQVNALARGLRALGIGRGDRVVLVSENRPEWLIADIAIMTAGGITVPAYTTNTSADHRHILSDSGARAVIVSTAALARNLLPAVEQTGSVELFISIAPLDDRLDGGRKIVQWDDLLAMGQQAATDVLPGIDAVQRTDTACIIYTSGTSGKPKGVMLSHGAILCNCMGARDLLTGLPGFQDGGELFLSFLPLSHSYEHTAGQFLPIAIGAEIYYAEGVDKLMANIGEVRPTIMTAVPRLYEAMHTRIRRGVEQAGGAKQWMFEKTAALGRKAYEQPQSMTLWERTLDRALDRLVRAKVRKRFGGRLKAFVSGGAPLNYDIGVFFVALGIRILQGYGQTESAPVISCNLPAKNKLHTVGPPLKGVEVKIAEDSEILVRGELVMQGYWNDPEATAAALRDGWLHTGDVGVIDEDGFIQITDRKKDIIVNSGGDNLSPTRVEGILTAEPEFTQAMVYGDKRPHLVAIVVPDPDFVQEWAKRENKPNDLTRLAQDQAFLKALHDAVDRVNANLSVIERVRRLMVAPEPFTIENEMMTPTLKLRRHVIRRKYGEALESLYAR